jgi:hypothetical protein
MTTISHTRPGSRELSQPLTAALAGAAVFALAMTAGEVLGLNSDGGSSTTTWGDLAAYAGLVLAAVALATWLGARARSATPDRMARYALGLATASAVTFVAFWSGWPHVLGAVAVVSALEHRRRVGGFGAMTGIAAILGAAALVASTVVCVVG